MVMTLLLTHPDCMAHEMGEWHPEAPARLKAVLKALDTDQFRELDRREAPKGTARQIEHVHAPFYVEAIFENVPASGHVHLDPDTAINSASGELPCELSAPCARPSTLLSMAQPGMLSAPYGRPVTTPSHRRRWGSACSTTSRLPQNTLVGRTGSSGSR